MDPDPDPGGPKTCGSGGSGFLDPDPQHWKQHRRFRGEICAILIEVYCNLQLCIRKLRENYFFRKISWPRKIHKMREKIYSKSEIRNFLKSKFSSFSAFCIFFGGLECVGHSCLCRPFSIF